MVSNGLVKWSESNIQQIDLDVVEVVFKQSAKV